MLELPNPWHVAIRSIGPVGRAVVAGATGGRIEAVFGSAFYVATDTGMICVGHEGMYDGPLNVVSHAPMTTDWQASGLRPGQSVALSSTLIRVGPSLVFSLTGSRLWAPKPKPVDHQLDGLPDVLGRHATTQHLPAAALPPVRGLEHALENAFRSGRLFRPDPRDVIALAGMGVGLTPAGDDVLGGMMIACHALGVPGFAEDLWRVLEPIVSRSGNAISAAHLNAASKGMGAAGLHDILHALLAGRSIEAEHLTEIDGIGHTSGRDALAGIAMVMRARFAAGSHVPPSTGET